MNGRKKTPGRAEVWRLERVSGISYDLWRRRFGSNEDAIGHSIDLNGRPFTVVGIAPKGFRAGRLDTAAELWVPVGRIGDVRPQLGNSLRNRHFRVFTVVARLTPGIGIQQAQAAAHAVAAGLEELDPSSGEPRRFAVLPAHTASFSPTDRETTARFAIMLSVVVALVLVMTCLNVSNLLLIRGSERASELAVRRTLGAERPRLVRQLLVESLCLAGTGGLVAVAVFLTLAPLLGGLELPGTLRVRPALDARVLLFTLTVTLLTGALVGTVPALRATGVDLVKSLKGKTPSLGKLREAWGPGGNAPGPPYSVQT